MTYPMEYLSGASGAVLGYTAGNIPGAYMGYKVGRMLGKRKRTVSKKPYSQKRRKVYKESKYKGGITTQHDRQLQYVKKSMPKYRKSAWKKFVKKVRAVELQDRGLITQQFQFMNTVGAAEYSQGFHAYHLYGIKDSALAVTANGGEPGHRDIQLIARNALLNTTQYGNPALNNANPEIGKFGFSKILFESAVLDVTIFNDRNYTQLVEVYHIWYKKKNDINTLAEAHTIFKNGLQKIQDTTTYSGVSDQSGIDLYNYGTSLFECGPMIARLGITIKSKRIYTLPAGQSVTYQIRDPKNHTIDLAQYLNRGAEQGVSPGYADPKLTETVLVVVKPPAYDMPEGYEGSGVRVTAIRTYKYSVEGNATDRCGTEYKS